MRNPKEAPSTEMPMTATPRPKRYDLEERTYLFAKRVRAFVKKLPRTVCNIEDVRQLVRASGSVGANYIEANEALGKKDFRMHIRISRKESKESRYWLRLVDTHDEPALNAERDALIQEATELMRIFGSILQKSEGNRNAKQQMRKPNCETDSRD
jgi:four helix bundle protein